MSAAHALRGYVAGAGASEDQADEFKESHIQI
jgi:hypothetical protein